MRRLSRKTIIKLRRKTRKLEKHLKQEEFFDVTGLTAQELSLYKTAKRLQEKPPSSENWFRKLYKQHLIYSDEFNVVFENKYIPDLINKEYKYIVEIDGKYHNHPKRKILDSKRDDFFKEKGYRVFRIPGFDKSTALNVISEIVKLRNPTQYLIDLFA